PRGPDSFRGPFPENGAGSDPGSDNKTAFIKFLDTGFSFGVEDRNILFYRVKPLFPERRWHGTQRPRWRGQSSKAPKRDNSGRRGKQNG
ncbi:MAG: hypothetical protein Q8O78_10460, partial [Candidatus Deferrimicrobium sp.]|nr:hypothetical protein [Candidatus Deferrimicrobium sp.]